MRTLTSSMVRATRRSRVSTSDRLRKLSASAASAASAAAVEEVVVEEEEEEEEEVEVVGAGRGTPRARSSLASSARCASRSAICSSTMPLYAARSLVCANSCAAS